MNVVWLRDAVVMVLLLRAIVDDDLWRKNGQTTHILIRMVLRFLLFGKQEQKFVAGFGYNLDHNSVFASSGA